MLHASRILEGKRRAERAVKPWDADWLREGLEFSGCGLSPWPGSAHLPPYPPRSIFRQLSNRVVKGECLASDSDYQLLDGHADRSCISGGKRREGRATNGHLFGGKV